MGTMGTLLTAIPSLDNPYLLATAIAGCLFELLHLELARKVRVAQRAQRDAAESHAKSARLETLEQVRRDLRQVRFNQWVIGTLAANKLIDEQAPPPTLGD